MQKREFKKPRFSIDRSQRGNLARQIAGGFCAAIGIGLPGRWVCN